MADSQDDDEGGGGGGGWIVSFADLMTLLFAAFVVLYGITPQGESDSIRGSVASIRSSFVEIPDDVIDKTLQKNLEKGVVVFDKAINKSHRHRTIKRSNRSETLIRGDNLDLDELDIKLDDQSKGVGIQPDLRQGSRSEKYEMIAPYRLLGHAFFERGASQLSDSERQKVIKIGKQFLNSPNQLVVEGHADKDEVKDSIKGYELATKRAESVRTLMIQVVGLRPERVLTAAYGSLRPLRAESQNDKETVNERVTIKTKKN